MKQKIADGIAQWLRDEAPLVFKMTMTPKMVQALTQAICDQFEAEDFDKVSD